MQPDDILDYWIGPRDASPDAIKVFSAKWYRGGDTVDSEIRERFGKALEQGLLGLLLPWGETARGAAAHVILLDQFARHAFRDTAKAFSGDALARAIAVRAVERGLHLEMTTPERVFLYHPFEHSEDPGDQDLSVALFEELAETVPDEWTEFVNGFTGYARAHREVIARFGRFPHRNALLDRETTSEEQEYLDAGGGF